MGLKISKNAPFWVNLCVLFRENAHKTHLMKTVPQNSFFENLSYDYYLWRKVKNTTE